MIASGTRCATCGTVFRGVTAFDQHRVGHFERRDPLTAVLLRANNRRCLTTDELVALGFAQQPNGMWGMTPNAIQQAALDRLRARRPRAREESPTP